MNDACQTSRCAQSKWKRKDSERNGSSVPHILVCLFLALWKLCNLSHLRARRRTHEREASVNKKDPSPNLDSPQTGTSGSSGPWTSSGRSEWLQNNRLLLSDGARRGLSAELKLYGGVCAYVSLCLCVWPESRRKFRSLTASSAPSATGVPSWKWLAGVRPPGGRLLNVHTSGHMRSNELLLTTASTLRLLSVLICGRRLGPRKEEQTIKYTLKILNCSMHW